MEQIKDLLRQYKWALLAGVIVAALIALITANLHVLEFVKYKMQNNTEGIIKTLQTSINGGHAEQEWYFNQGMDYLLEQETYTDETKEFFEVNFNKFNAEMKGRVLNGYNEQKSFLTVTKPLMTFLVQNQADEIVKGYIQRIPVEDMDLGLSLVYGNEMQVDANTAKLLNQLLAIYPERLPFEKFKFDIYGLLELSMKDKTINVKGILDKINLDKARAEVFARFKKQTITEQQMNTWLKLFKDTSIITAEEYAKYEGLYSELCVIRTQYQSLDAEEVDLKNKKEQVEAQIKTQQEQLATKQKEISEKQSKIGALESQIDTLTGYMQIALYIEEGAASGKNEYIASIPRGGLFGFRPSGQKYVVKLTQTAYIKPGVYNLNVYLKGTTQLSNGKSYEYYVEVGSSDFAEIDKLRDERSSMMNALETLEQDAQSLQAQIDAIKVQNNYDANEEALNNISTRRTEYINKMGEKVASIKALFGFKEITIDVKGSAEV